MYVSLETPFTVFSYSKNWEPASKSLGKAEQGCLRSHAAIEKTPDLGNFRQIRCGIMGGILAGWNSPFLRWRLQRLDEFIRKQVLNSVR
jgi:hypothetical protein